MSPNFEPPKETIMELKTRIHVDFVRETTTTTTTTTKTEHTHKKTVDSQNCQNPRKNENRFTNFSTVRNRVKITNLYLKKKNSYFVF